MSDEKQSPSDITNQSQDLQEHYANSAQEFMQVLPDLYRLARHTFKQNQADVTQQLTAMFETMNKTKEFLALTTEQNNTQEFIQDILDDDINNCPQCPDKDSKTEED